MLWALLYDLGGALDSFSEALYFSLVAFTSLGYGDVTVGVDWRLVAGCQALSGLLLVGMEYSTFGGGAAAHLGSTAQTLLELKNLYP